jgi:hypothetical protein
MLSLFNPTSAIAARIAQSIGPLARMEHDARQFQQQEDAALQEQIAALSRLKGMRAPAEMLPRTNLREALPVLAADLLTGLFDRNHQPGQITQGFMAGRSAQTELENRNRLREHEQARADAGLDVQIAGVKADYAGKRRTESQTRADRERLRIEGERERDERNLDRALGRYNTANTPQEKVQAGKLVQSLQRSLGLQAMTSEEIAEDAAAIASGRLAKAQTAFRALYEPDIKAFGVVDESRVEGMEIAAQAIADEWGVKREALGEIPTMESMAKQRLDFWMGDVNRRFKHLQDTDRVKLAQAATRLEQAQRALQIAEQRLLISRDMTTIAAYNAATARMNSEIAAAKGQLGTFESGDMGKLANQIEMLEAKRTAAETNEDEEKVVEIDAEIGVLRGRLGDMQNKVLAGFGITIEPGNFADIGNAMRSMPTQAGIQVPAGPQIGAQPQGASAKELTIGGKPTNVQAVYQAAQAAIARAPKNKAAIIKRYEEALKAAGIKEWKWPG